MDIKQAKGITLEGYGMAGQSKGDVDGLLADSFMDLAMRKPIEKITIKEITDRAGVIRPTFYNHYQDKYELLEWIIEGRVLEPAKPLLRADLVNEALLLIFTGIERDREFYLKASRLEGQNSFESIVRNCISRTLLEIMGDHEIFRKPPNAWITPEHVAEYYALSMSYVAISWIKSGLVLSAREMVEIYNYIIKHSIEEVLLES